MCVRERERVREIGRRKEKRDFYLEEAFDFCPNTPDSHYGHREEAICNNIIFGELSL